MRRVVTFEVTFVKGVNIKIPLLASAGVVVTGVSKQFGVYCLPVVLFLVLTPYGGRDAPVGYGPLEPVVYVHVLQ